MEETISAFDNSSETSSNNPASMELPGNDLGTEANLGQAQASQGGAPDDIFRGIDPNRLPPELKAIYDSMLTDYRGKTAKLSETIKAETSKASEAYRQKAELYDQIAGQDEFVKQWNEYVQKAQQPSQPSGDPALAEMKAKLQEINQKIQLSELSQVANAFADAVDEKGNKLHPDFDQLNGISIGQLRNGNEAEDFSLLRACVELASGNSPQEKLANGYKSAKALRDAIFEEGKKAGMGRIQAKVLNGSNPPSSSSGDILTKTDKKPKNAHEALEMARKGIVVSA